MALDISGFLVPEQKYEGLYKIGDALAAKDLAKAKAAETAKANKAALLKIPEAQFNAKDYLSGTIADPNITNRLYKGLQQVNEFIEQNPGATQSQVNSIAFPIASQIAQDSEKSKVLKRQMEAGIEQVKGIKGANVDKFVESFQNRAWGIQNNIVPDNLNNVDITHNYVNDVLNNDDIYNLDVAVGEDIKNMGKSSEMKDVMVRDAKGNITKVKKKVQTSSSFVPDIDAQGVFQGVVPEHTVAPSSDATKSISKYISGDPNKELRLVSDNEFNRMRYNLGVMGAINAETKKYAQAIGRVPTPEEIIAFQKAKLFDVYSNNAKVGFAHEDVQETKAPVTRVSVNVGGTGDKTLQFRDIYKQVIDRFEQEAEGVERGGQAAFVPINKMEADAGDIITDIANKRNPGRATKYNASDLYIVRTGDMKGREIRDMEGNLVMPFNKPEDINPKGNYGTKVKQQAATTPGAGKTTSKGASNKKVTDPDILRQLNQK